MLSAVFFREVAMLNKRDVVVHLQKKLDKAKEEREKVAKRVRDSGTHPARFDYSAGVVDGIDSAIVAVIAMEDCEHFERKYYVHPNGFVDGTAYIEKIGDHSKICVPIDDSQTEISGWDSEYQSFVDCGEWIEVSQTEAENFLKMAKLVKSKKENCNGQEA
jgi:hypothetical protein